MEDYVVLDRSKGVSDVACTVACLDVGSLDMIVLFRHTRDLRSGIENIECLVFDGLVAGTTGRCS